MRSKRTPFMIAAVVAAWAMSSIGLSIPQPAQASTTAYACPTSARETSVQQLDWRPATFSPITNLIACENPFVRNAGDTIKSVALSFGTLSPSAFAGNTMKIRIVATPANFGFWVTAYTDVSVDQNQGGGNPNRVLPAYQVAANTSQQTLEIPVTATDAQKVKILSGDFVVVVGTIGGAGPNTETITSVSIPFTQFTAAFDGNGASGSMAAQSANPGTALSTNTFVRSGFTFSGWNTLADGTGVFYADGAAYPFAADETLYAQWTANPNSPNAALAKTGSSNWILLGTVGTLTVLGLMMVAYSMRRRRQP